MKKFTLALCSLIFLSPLFAEIIYPEEVVTIYNNMDNGLFGRSLYRGITSSVKDSEFKRAGTYYVDTDIGYYLTAVTIDATVVDRLKNLMTSGNSLMIDEFEISIDQSLSKTFSDKTIYRIQSRRTGLDMSISFEKPTNEMIRMIETYYQNDNYSLGLVSNYYKQNYVISVYAAENLFENWNHEISLSDAMLMATIIGDIEQPMWGIHNGNGLLKRIIDFRS